MSFGGASSHRIMSHSVEAFLIGDSVQLTTKVLQHTLLLNTAAAHTTVLNYTRGLCLQCLDLAQYSFVEKKTT